MDDGRPPQANPYRQPASGSVLRLRSSPDVRRKVGSAGREKSERELGRHTRDHQLRGERRSVTVERGLRASNELSGMANFGDESARLSGGADVTDGVVAAGVAP